MLLHIHTAKPRIFSGVFGTVDAGPVFDYDLCLFSEGGDGGDGDASAGGGEGTCEVGTDAQFDELIRGEFKGAFAKRCQKVIDKRFKESKQLKEFADGARGVIDRLKEKFSIEEDDFDAIIEKLDGGGIPTASAAEDSGEVGGERGKSEKSDDAAFGSKVARHLASREIYEGFLAEAGALKEIYPTFELEKECESPYFTALLSLGLGMRDAFEALHKDEIIGEAMEYTARAVAEALSRSRMSRAGRPFENSLAAVSTQPSRRSVSTLSDGEIIDIVKMVERGEKVRL